MMTRAFVSINKNWKWAKRFLQIINKAKEENRKRERKRRMRFDFFFNCDEFLLLSQIVHAILSSSFFSHFSSNLLRFIFSQLRSISCFSLFTFQINISVVIYSNIFKFWFVYNSWGASLEITMEKKIYIYILFDFISY